MKREKMSQADNPSTFLIKSSANKSFGTGFCVHQDKQGSYLVTCSHVVNACGEESLKVGELSAKVIANSTDETIIDLAVVYVQGLMDVSTLNLVEAVYEVGETFEVTGFRPHKSDEYRATPLQGAIVTISDIVSTKTNEILPTYQLSIDNVNTIEKGYSGSAVVDTQTGNVFAIATDRNTNGQQAYATSAKYLKAIWQEMPEGIFVSNESSNPYKGLNYFTYEDRKHYYGREKESQEIAKALETTKLFTLSGASGSGKSSLIYAGIVPLIEGEEVEILTLRPQDKPFKNLASVFIPTLYPDELEGLRKTKELTSDLESGSIEITALVQHYLDKTKAKKLYLVIDQFEELFTLTKEQEKRNLFLDRVLELIESDLNVSVLISMRADFLSHLSFYEPFNQAYNEHPNTILSLLSEEKLRKVIEAPALSQGVKFQDGLVDRIIDEIENEVGQLPLLEFALNQLWTNQISILKIFNKNKPQDLE
jgi:energy-coupling factor transporter ATP-binding protein EcfA2